ncbi:DNA ligase D [Bacillus sp. CGMCC 1.16607]|uniref:DNA ligase D n=1 Tax=Bacillus sp. CGMCC 1.16607 TaxID=3351842 RepID=UPI00362ADDA8
MKPMLPNLQFAPPEGKDWVYETKYDGFRCICTISQKDILLNSRNEKTLLPQFPEIKQYISSIQNKMDPYLPLVLDGEIVLFDNVYKADFGGLQIRGRLRSVNKINEEVAKRPAALLVFDLLSLKGKELFSKTYKERKKLLHKLFTELELPLNPNMECNQNLQMIPCHNDLEKLWDQITLYDGEGIIAKREDSIWEEGKRSSLWIKHKNWKMVSCFVTAYDKENGYFHVAVYHETSIFPIGLVLFGFKPEEKQALAQTVKQNKHDEDAKFIYAPPGICLEIKYLEWYENQLREPHFHQFRFDLTPDQCTYEQFYFQQKNLPKALTITHPEKPLWEKPKINKMEYLFYLREISSYMLPFLKDHLLTVIRYPHGLFGEPFYQKNCPDYAPPFIETYLHEEINYILCNDLKTLIWLGNQLAIEFHIPFQTIRSKEPCEIVFDLDPPSKNEFPLAIKAAKYIKEIIDELKLIGFIKTSGSKGLQIHIPLPENTFSYDDTRLFTTFIAEYLVTKEPELFTIERMKKNRGNRLYIDYIQHAEGKTIIAPYSARGREQATVATPLFWEEVDEQLQIEQFTIQNVVRRVKNQGCPFREYFKLKKQQPFKPVLQFLKQNI